MSDKDNPAYGCWLAMKARCRTDPDYAGRGITVCEAWLWSFAYFLEDMGPRPSERHSIERLDNEGHYEPDNCEWALPLDQSNNRRTTKPLMERIDGRHGVKVAPQDTVGLDLFEGLPVVTGAYLIGHLGERVEPRYWARVP